MLLCCIFLGRKLTPIKAPQRSSSSPNQDCWHQIRYFILNSWTVSWLVQATRSVTIIQPFPEDLARDLFSIWCSCCLAITNFQLISRWPRKKQSLTQFHRYLWKLTVRLTQTSIFELASTWYSFTVACQKHTFGRKGQRKHELFQLNMLLNTAFTKN